MEENLAMVVEIHNSRSSEVELGGSGFQGHPELSREFETNLGIMRTWL